MDERFRTNDTYASIALWATGWPLLDAELGDDGRTVVFVFPNDEDGSIKADFDAHARGELMIPSVAVREGHRQVRDLIAVAQGRRPHRASA